MRGYHNTVDIRLIFAFRTQTTELSNPYIQYCKEKKTTIIIRLHHKPGTRIIFRL